MSTRQKKFFDIVIVLLLVLIFTLIIIFYINKKIEKTRIDKFTLLNDSLHTEALRFILAMKLDSAKILLDEIVIIPNVKGKFEEINISSKILLSEIENYKINQNEKSFKHFLVKMTPDEYKKLNQNNLIKKYFSNSKLNEEFIKILYDNRAKRNKYIAEELALQRKKEMEEQEAIRQAEIEKKKREKIVELQNAALRKQYEIQLREKYLDQGVNIKVHVYGRNNTIIKLSYPLFNEVWAHKLQKGTLIDEIKNLGFRKLEMTDGNNYNVYWDFK
jgi:hypothetical protein